MKKTLTIFGMLAIGYANAQYDGRVGINTETPSATLNVKSTGDTASTKNLELENSKGTKMVTVLDNGRVGIGTERPQQKLHVEEGAIRITHSSNEGAFLELENPLKTGVTEGNRWRIYNMTGNDTTKTSRYVPGLHFWNYSTGTGTAGNLRTKMIIADGGNVGIGTFDPAVGTPTHKLDVLGDARVRGLAGTGDRAVYADADGVLKVGAAGSASSGVNTDPTMECNATNTGKINFGAVTINGSATEAFGFCMKNSAGNYRWYYIYGGAATTSGSGKFGS